MTYAYYPVCVLGSDPKMKIWRLLLLLWLNNFQARKWYRIIYHVTHFA